jgi:hypothetical protein
MIIIPCEYCLKPIAQGRAYATKIKIKDREVEIYLHCEGHDPNSEHTDFPFVDCARNFRLYRSQSDLEGEILCYAQLKERV